MTEQEINKTIAEYIGDYHTKGEVYIGTIMRDIHDCEYTVCYTTSLDACIPVVEKLGMNWFDITREKEKWFKNKVHLVESEIRYSYNCQFQDSEYNMSGAQGSTPAIALATALAKAIKEKE